MNWTKLNEVTLLVAEDDDFNRQLITSILARNNKIKVIEAKDGKEVLSLLNSKSIDALLLDIHMPNMDGFETLTKIRESKTQKNLPVIVITSDETERKKIFSMGANDFIPKPFKLQELESKIYNVLSEH